MSTNGKIPRGILQMQSDKKSLLKELEVGQLEYANGPMPPARGKELESKAKELEELNAHIDAYERISGIVNDARKVDNVTLPADKNGRPRTTKTTVGHMFVGSESFRQYKAQGKQGWSAKVDVKGRPGKIVTLRGEEAIAYEAKAFDSNDLSDLGTDAIIEMDRDREIVRYEEPEVLTIRDVLGSANTTADTIRYVKHTATTRAAASQATRGAAKDYLKVEFDAENVSVETIAVLSKVTEQDIDDAPRLISIINGEMALDIKVEEERQLLWGQGSSGELLGLYESGIPEFDRAGMDDTVIDTIRRMRTDLRKKKVTPNFVAVDPIDWEAIELSKGSDDRYIWGLITDLRGPRIWSLRVVESDAMTDTTTDERRILMGDGIRGATIYDRHAVRLAIGYVDDDFARNLRTLRAEERLALAVKRNWAFMFAKTQAPSS